MPIPVGKDIDWLRTQAIRMVRTSWIHQDELAKELWLILRSLAENLQQNSQGDRSSESEFVVPPVDLDFPPTDGQPPRPISDEVQQQDGDNPFSQRIRKYRHWTRSMMPAEVQGHVEERDYTIKAYPTGGLTPYRPPFSTDGLFDDPTPETWEMDATQLQISESAQDSIPTGTWVMAFVVSEIETKVIDTFQGDRQVSTDTEYEVLQRKGYMQVPIWY